MMKLIFVGKTREKFLREGIFEFLKRIQKFRKVEVIEITDSKIEEETRKILSIVKNNFLVVLDVNGRELSSEEFAEFIKKNVNEKIYFVIGSHHGLPEDILRRANFKISLSRMTFTHELARLILIEQIYRAFMIIQGREYHR